MYTKGVWKAEDLGDCYLIMADETTCVARTGKTYYPTEAQEANANLIASAPDMYEALRKTHTLITSIIPNDLVSESAKHTMQKIIVKALSKAEGK